MKRTKRMMSLILAVLLLTVLLAGCGDEANPKDGDSGKKDSLTVRVTIPFSNLDPHSHNTAVGFMVDPQIFDPLVILDDYTMETAPCLAESWDVSEDGKEYVFHLKSGVTFHNGNSFTSKDVKYSYERVLGGTFLNSVISMVDRVEAVDDLTAKIILKEPFSPFLKAVQQIYIVDEETINEQGEAALKNPIGTGPYRFMEWNEKDQRVSLEKYEDYHGAPANISKLNFTVITDANTAAIALESGDIDFAIKMDANSYYSLKDNDKIVVDSAPTSHMFYLIFNNASGVTANKKLRQAISCAIDRDAIVMVNSDGFDQVTGGYLYEGITGYSGGVDMYEYNPEYAKELLKEAGLENLELSFMSDREYVAKIAQVVQANLADVGITLNIEQIDAAAFDEKIYGKTYEMAYWSNSNYSMDADDLYKWYYSGSGTNITYYNNQEFDRLVTEARSAASDEEREVIYRQALEIFKEEAPIVPIYFQTQFDAYAKGLKTSGIRPAGYPRFSNYSWE